MRTMTTFNVFEGFAIDDELAEAFAWMAERSPIAWDESDDNGDFWSDGVTLSIVRVTPTDASILANHYELDFLPEYALIPFGDDFARYTYELTLSDSLAELIELAESAYGVRMVTE